LPAAFAPIRVYGPDGIIFDSETSSVVTAAETSDGVRYTVESVLPRYDVARLRAADAPPTAELAERYLALPADFPAELADQAREIIDGASTRYDQAVALQSWFRSFTYDLSSVPGHSQNAMQEFLAQRRGYCEQFAGTYAAFARVLGLPSRVALGFTPGEQRDDGRYYVQGQARSRVARDLLRRCRLGAVRAHARAGQSDAVQYTGVRRPRQRRRMRRRAISRDSRGAGELDTQPAHGAQNR
jgi:transglutaminase-like putative cysteine protease